MFACFFKLGQDISILGVCTRSPSSLSLIEHPCRTFYSNSQFLTSIDGFPPSTIDC